MAPTTKATTTARATTVPAVLDTTIPTPTGVITTATRTGLLTITPALGTRSTLLPAETPINPTVPLSDSSS